MKFVNLETGKVSHFVKSECGFTVCYHHGIEGATLTSIRAIQTDTEFLYTIWNDYMVLPATYIMFTSLESGEKFVVMRE